MRSHIRVLSPAGLAVALLGFAAAIWLLLGALVSPALAGSDKGEVVFRVTLTGPVDADDHFTLWSRCPDEWCQPPSIPGVPTPDFYEKPVVVCGRNLAPPADLQCADLRVDLGPDPGAASVSV